MKKLLVATLSVCSALAACGGGGSGNNNSSTANTFQPFSVAYADYNASVGIPGAPWNGASFVDNMPTKTNTETLTKSGWTGQIIYGVSGNPKTIQVNNAALANTRS